MMGADGSCTRIFLFLIQSCAEYVYWYLQIITNVYERKDSNYYVRMCICKGRGSFYLVNILLSK